MKFDQVTVFAVFTAIGLVSSKVDAVLHSKNNDFVGPPLEATFKIFHKGENKYRVVVKEDNANSVMKSGNGRLKGGKYKLQGGPTPKVVKIFGDNHEVVEFDNSNDMDEFVQTARQMGVTVESDPVIYPLTAKRTDNKNRLLQEEVPWGINDVFTRKDGTVDVPGPDYFPEETHKICIIDSGYEDSHPDLVSSATNADPAQSRTYNQDLCKHGTHVAGTVLASDNDEGVIGVFPGASALIVKVFNKRANCGWSYASELVDAANHCKDAGAKIITMSLGGGASTNFEVEAFRKLDDEGILNIAAAGNDGNSDKSYPASYDHVMSVGAVDSNHNIADFSQHNDQVDISGPGVGVKSTTGSSGYSNYDGTSMATPHVSGVALLLWNKYPDCTNAQIREALENGALDEGDQGRDDFFGYGIVRYWNSVDYLENKPCSGVQSPTASPVVFPTASPITSSAPTTSSTSNSSTIVTYEYEYYN